MSEQAKPKLNTIRRFTDAACQYLREPDKNTFEIELKNDEAEVFTEWLKSCPTINPCNCPKCRADLVEEPEQ